MIDVKQTVTRQVTDYFEDDYPSDFLPTLVTTDTKVRLWGRRIFSKERKEEYLIKIDHWQGDKKKSLSKPVGFGNGQK